MMKVDVAHIRAAEPLSDGSYLAVTIQDRGDCGVMVWAGRLDASTATRHESDCDPSNYTHRENVSFMSWRDVAEYFEGREFEPLIQQFIEQYMRHETSPATSRRRDESARARA